MSVFVVWCVLVIFEWCEIGLCPGAGLASFDNLHNPEDVVYLPKLALEAAHHVKQWVLPDVH